MLSINMNNTLTLSTLQSSEKKLISKLDRTKNEIRKLKVSGTTYDFGTSQSDKIDDKLLQKRNEYFKVLKKLNALRAKKKKQKIKTNSKNLLKSKLLFDKLARIGGEKASKAQSYRTQLTTKFYTTSDVQYKTSVFDTLVY